MSQPQLSDKRAEFLDQSSTVSQLTGQTGNKEDEENELAKATSEQEYPPTRQAVLITCSLFLITFLITLDRTVVGVAVPRITDEFDSLGDIGWYGSAYLLTSCAMTLVMGRVYTLWNPKWVYLTALIIFEIGSAVSGSAPNSNALIIGRAIAGLGNAGLFQGSIILIVYIVPLHKRPKYMGVGGLMIGLASSLGPLIGGALTDGPGWRWCFYINLPCGALAFVLVVLVLHVPTQMLHRKPATVKEAVARLNPLGVVCLLPCIICLLLTLQWGGVTYNWSNARIIVLFVLSAALFAGFVLEQKRQGENALVPGRIAFRRSILAAGWFTFCNGAAFQTLIYYLPIWFQAIRGASAVKSGIMNLPLLIGQVITSVSAGIITKKIGYFTQWMIMASVLTSIGAGLISTFTPTTNHSAWIGYQALYGLGFGLGIQQPSITAQTILDRKDVPIGASLMVFCQTLGGSIFISVANNIFDSRLEQDLKSIAGLGIGSVVQTGATDLRNTVSSGTLPQVLVAYNDALRAVFHLATGLACATIIGVVFMQWPNVKKDQQKQNPNAGEDKEQPSENAK